jgi:hypothetical protein
MIHMRGVRREDLVKQLVRKMAPPLGPRFPTSAASLR